MRIPFALLLAGSSLLSACTSNQALADTQLATSSTSSPNLALVSDNNTAGQSSSKDADLEYLQDLVDTLECNKVMGDRVGRVPIWQRDDDPAYFFHAGMQIDADGAPDAYHPKNIGTDNLKHAGKNGRWWGVVTHNLKPRGRPVVQGKNDPNPGYYVSTTSLFDPKYKHHDPRRYVNANTIPYFVLPKDALPGIQIGDIAAIFNRKNGRLVYAIYADRTRAKRHGRIGEGSIALAKALDIDANPRKGGVNKGIFYIVFPNSGNKRPRSPAVIKRLGYAHFKQWGGVERLQQCLRVSTR